MTQSLVTGIANVVALTFPPKADQSLNYKKEASVKGRLSLTKNKNRSGMSKPKIKVDVVSDVVCPWCYIGKRRLEKAIDNLKDSYEFEIEYHPFELNPQMPAGGLNHKEYLTEKFGGEERYDQLTGRVIQVAAAEGLTFDFEKQITSPNTRKAHALIQLAHEKGKQLPVMEAFFKAYFTDGVDLSQDKNLIDVAVDAGLDRVDAEGALSDENSLVQVALAEQEMYKLGISGVPFYILNNKYGVSGAQSSETFMKAFLEIGTQTPEAEACDVDSKNC
ncbi:MAG TPA: DsbA family oxidoreductase [Ohtaekwangia sp.]